MKSWYTYSLYIIYYYPRKRNFLSNRWIAKSEYYKHAKNKMCVFLCVQQALLSFSFVLEYHLEKVKIRPVTWKKYIHTKTLWNWNKPIFWTYVGGRGRVFSGAEIRLVLICQTGIPQYFSAWTGNEGKEKLLFPYHFVWAPLRMATFKMQYCGQRVRVHSSKNR